MSNAEKAVRQESVQNPEQSYKFVVLRPGGNDTGLIAGVIDDPIIRKQTNDALMARYPNVEQTGSVCLDEGRVRLQMSGGEFCGNATRSTAWLALGGQPGEIRIQVSGVSRLLKAGVTANKEAFAEMPIYADTTNVTEDPEIPGNYVVRMEGIVQYIDFRPLDPGVSEEELKIRSFEFLQSRGLTQEAAAGVIYSKQTENGWEITPVVYVRDIDTLFYETACGSGTTALGMVLALKDQKPIRNVPIIQPTGLPISVTVELTDGKFTYAQISGPLEIVVPMDQVTLSMNTEKEGI